MSGGPRRDWWLLSLVGIAICAVLLLLHAYTYDYVVDDAYISLRYARNLVAGHGLVFNPGERVEGYTNFLWVMLAALGLKLGLDAVILVKVLGFVSAVLSMVVVFWYSRVVYGRAALAGLLPAAFLAASPAMAVWALGGLETTFFALLVTSAVLSHIRGLSMRKVPLASSVLLTGAALTRPEGLIFAVILFADLLAARTSKRRVALWLVPFVAVLVPYFIWRFSYYGYLFPNAYYAKTGGGASQLARGLGYVRNYVASAGGLLSLLVLAPVFLAGGRKYVLPAIVCAVWGMYVVAVGGDSLAMYRFLVPVLPLSYLLIVQGLLLVHEKALAGRPPRVAHSALASVLVVSLLLVLSNSLGSTDRDFVREDRTRVQGNWVPIGKWLKDYAKSGESMAVTSAGAVPYYSGLATIDMLGINDARIAHRRMPRMGGGLAGHEKHDMEYVISKRPTYIFHYLFMVKRPVITRDQFLTEWNPGEASLPDLPDFNRMYEPVSEQIAGLYLNFFRLKPEYRKPEY